MTVDTLPAPPLALGLALVALALLGALVLWRRGRRRPATPVSVGLLDPELPEEVEPHTVRALRAQVRALEEALENVVDPEPVPAPVPVVATEPVLVATPDPDALASYRRQVRLAVRAVAVGTTSGDDPQHAVARVAAAIERLDRPGVLARPALPETFGRSVPPPASASVPIARTARTAVAAVAAAVAPAPEPELDDEPDVMAHLMSVRASSALRSDTETETDDQAEVVLPVPPPAPAEPRRGRRRQRHSAA
jgi:hypothetical protein